MKEDFSGYATKANLKCKDGRVIMPDAFKHQDKIKVPLVWQHGHNDPENVLGHAILENREDGVYAYGFFNRTPRATHMAEAVRNKDITMMSIWANELVERSKRVLHGAIREVSLVLSGANPGAKIENVTIRHSDGDEMELDDEAVIFTGLELMHSSGFNHADGDGEEGKESKEGKEGKENEGDSNDEGDYETVEDVYNSMTEAQKRVLHYMVGEALSSAEEDDDNDNDNDNKENDEDDEMSHNIFEKGNDHTGNGMALSHSEITSIVSDAERGGSLKDAVEDFALAHGIENIDVLFPDAQAIDKTPEFLQRRSDWVNDFLGGVQKRPFSRIKTLSADLTFEDARAKGYVTGNMKREEFFTVSKRVTDPTTIYKRQKLERDDMVDITDFDVVGWLKAEMRLMLDEEMARSMLIGDGRDVADPDKINESNIRPVAKDHDLFNTTVVVDLSGSNASVQNFIDAVVESRRYYKGTGSPTMYTTETYIAKFLLLKDTLGRRIYSGLDDIATELRVNKIVPVEPMEEDPDLIAVFVNPQDYVAGANAGGQVSMFDDFDIDFNQHKYLIEARTAGALARLKSAITFRKANVEHELTVPEAPAFNPDTGELVIPDTEGVIYRDSATEGNVTNTTITVGAGEFKMIVAEPDDGYYFKNTDGKRWTFRRPN